MEEAMLSRYEQIACDIAKKIASGRYPVGDRLRGRSTLAGLYKVSPETMRKALALLDSQGVVRVKHGSGVYVLSAEKAKQFLERTDIQPRFRRKLDELANLIAKRRELDRRIDHCMMELTRFAMERFDAGLPPDSAGEPNTPRAEDD